MDLKGGIDLILLKTFFKVSLKNLSQSSLCCFYLFVCFFGLFSNTSLHPNIPLKFLATNCKLFTLRKYELNIVLRRFKKLKLDPKGICLFFYTHLIGNISLDLCQIYSFFPHLHIVCYFHVIII